VYSDTCVQNLVDSSFNKIRGEIRERAKILDKSLRITIGAWISKLSEEVSTDRVVNYSSLKRCRLNKPHLLHPFTDT
jgi:hypothetical protein